MKNRTKRAIELGVMTALLVAGSAWYTVQFNDSRFLAPMDLSEYTFRPQDLPMLASGIVLLLYLIYLAVLCFGAAQKKQNREKSAKMTRKVDPRFGFLGLLGFAGFLGFWTYGVDKTIFPFVFFVFFGFFGFFYEGRMSGTFMDERYLENKLRAQATANKTTVALVFLATLILGQGKLMGNLEYTLIAFLIVVSLSIALGMFLSEYLLYRYDSDDAFAESEE